MTKIKKQREECIYECIGLNECLIISKTNKEALVAYNKDGNIVFEYVKFPNKDIDTTIEQISDNYPNKEKQKELVLSLDVNNPRDISQYASVMCITEKDAKDMLMIHQKYILNNK